MRRSPERAGEHSLRPFLPMRTNPRDFLLGAACAASVLVWKFQPAPVAAAQAEIAPPQFVLESGTGKFGGPILFVLDTKSRVLSIYEAEGGTPATRGITWLGARKIEHDINTTFYNDKSEVSYSDLKQRFEAEFSKRAAGSADELGEGDK